MAKYIIYPKKKPGYTNVRTSPKVNNGTLNNLLVKVPYGVSVGTTTGITAKEKVENKEYIWFQVKTIKGVGYVREDGFSYKVNNADVQQDPVKERLKIAEKDLLQTVGKLQSVGAKLKVIGTNAKKLTATQAKNMQTVRASYIKSITKLQKTGAVTLKVNGPLGTLSGLGIIWTVPLILGAGIIVSSFSAFVIDRAMKWFAEVHQVESEADQQLAVIATLEKTAAGTDSAAAQDAVKALEEIAKRSEETQQKVQDSQAGSDIMSNVKQIAIYGGLAFVALEVYKASRK